MLNNARLLVTSPNARDWPDKKKPEVLFAGRSNVGKSSLINALTGQKKLAYTGKTPGKTRMLNFYSVDDKLLLVDAPGYGFAVSSNKNNVDFDKLMTTYFQLRKPEALLLLVDCRRGINQDDIMMKELADYYGINTLIVLTKIDKCNKDGRLSTSNAVSEKLNIPSSRIVWTSSENKEGIDNLEKRILAFCKK